MNIQLYGQIKPYVWQQQAHQAISDYLSETEKYQKVITIKASRQRYGKSCFSKAELLRFAFTRKGSINAYIAPTLKLSKKMYNEIVASCTGLIIRKNSIDLSITFVTGSTVRLFSAEQRENLRGFTVTGVMIIDEGAFIRDDVYTELLSPWVTVHQALTIIISTPKYRTGFFYQLYKEGLKGDKHHITLDWVNDHEVAFDEFTLRQKELIPVQNWRSEYLGEFLDARGSVFGAFDKNILDYTPGYQELYWGLDFASGTGNDYTVLTALNEKAEMVYQWRVNNMPPTGQVNRIASILDEFRPYTKKIQAESNSIGRIYLDLLKEKGLTITSFTTTNDSKRKLVEKMQVAFETGRIRIMNDIDLINELSFYEQTIHPVTHKVTYNAPSGMHDDCVMSLLLAHDALTNKAGYKYFII